MATTEHAYRICSKTVMDTSDPTIDFDVDGISNHYWDFQHVIKPNWNEGRSGKKQLELAVNQIRKDGKEGTLIV